MIPKKYTKPKKYTNISYSVEAVQWKGDNLFEIKWLDPSTPYRIRGEYNYIVDSSSTGHEIGSWLVKKNFYFEDIRDGMTGDKTGWQRRVDEDYYFWLSNDEFNNQYQDENKKS